METLTLCLYTQTALLTNSYHRSSNDMHYSKAWFKDDLYYEPEPPCNCEARWEHVYFYIL